MENGGQNNHNVFTMTQNVSHNGFAPLAQLEAYWEALRGGRLMPNRAEIDPRGIEQALEYSFIVERIAPGIARLRIAGSHLSDLMGMEVRGMPLTSFITAGSRRQLSDVLEEVFETPATCSLQLRSEEGGGLQSLDARMVLMPLKSDLGDVRRILGALVSVGEMGRSPRRFDILRTSLRPILTNSAQPPVARKKPVVKEPTVVPGFQEAKTPFAGEKPRPKAPYLRLVKSDD